jgi:hypothetical protein
MKKTRSRKSRDTVPLKNAVSEVEWYLICSIRTTLGYVSVINAVIMLNM